MKKDVILDVFKNYIGEQALITIDIRVPAQDKAYANERQSAAVTLLERLYAKGLDDDE